MRQLLEAYELSAEQKTAIESSSNVKNEFLNVMSVCFEVVFQCDCSNIIFHFEFIMLIWICVFAARIAYSA